MESNETAVDVIGVRVQKFWYRVGGISAVVLGLGYLAIIPLYAHVGAPPSGGEAWFNYLPSKTTIWWAILALSVFTDLLYIPIALVLYLALEKVNRGAMLLAASFFGLFVALDLAITWTHYASMLVLFSQYSATTTDVQRAGYLAAANYGAAALASRLEVVIAIVIPAIGTLVTGLVMLRGVFNKFTAWLAVITGLFGIASLTGLAVAIYGNALLLTLWFFFIAYRLYRLAQE